MHSVQKLSHAKINWYLEVGPKRSDGFHDLRTVFQELSLADEMTFERIEHPDCVIEGFPPEIPTQSNLIYKAWSALQTLVPERVHGVRIVVKKMIPACGGMGGGSSNAAATLRAVNDLFELGLGYDELAQVGAQLGSDVPFFVRGGCAIGEGRGEILTNVHSHHTFWLVLLFPKGKISTADAYRQLDEIPRSAPEPDRMAKLVDALGTGDADALAGLIHNDFELPAASCSWFRECRFALESAGALRAFLCGSGSTVAGLVPSRKRGYRMVQQLQLSIGYEATLCRVTQFTHG